MNKVGMETLIKLGSGAGGGGGGGGGGRRRWWCCCGRRWWRSRRGGEEGRDFIRSVSKDDDIVRHRRFGVYDNDSSSLSLPA